MLQEFGSAVLAKFAAYKKTIARTSWQPSFYYKLYSIIYDTSRLC